jgi:DNA-binding NarL/FixJ family response regulator
MTPDDAMRVLIVEDNPGDARLLRVWLSESVSPRFRVSQVARLADAGAHAEAIAYDAVLLDLSLPDSSGVDTVTRFREHAPDSAIVVVSGLEDARVATETVHHGAQEYLVKGDINGRSLAAAITRAIVRHRLATGALKLVEQARASTARLRGILHQLPDGLVLHDANGLVAYANPAAEQMLGCRAGTTLPGPFVRVQPDWNGTIEVVSPSGATFVVDANAHAIEGDTSACRALLLRPRATRHTTDSFTDVPLDPVGRATLRAGLECMAWRVDRLATLMHRLLEHRAEPYGAEALELADDLGRLLGDAMRSLPPSNAAPG